MYLMNISTRKATEKDFPAVLSLIRELANFEKAPEKVTNSVEQMRQEKHLFECFVAETETGEIVGMALYFFAYFTWVGKSLYLEDIYIKESYRKQNLGTALLKRVFEVARQEDCKRVRWQVLNWNSSAIQMYKKNGAEIDDEWLNCNFDAEGIRRFGILTT
jgi:GNAT superfamily N-acetyltransferase